MNKRLIENIKSCLGGDELEDFNFLLSEKNKYEKGFNILMEYWDSIHDEEKPKVDKRLLKLGL